MWKYTFQTWRNNFSKTLLMNIHWTHHIYKIALRRKCVWKHFFLIEFSSAAPTTKCFIETGPITKGVMGFWNQMRYPWKIHAKIIITFRYQQQHIVVLETMDPFKMDPTSMSNTTFICCGCSYGCNLISLPLLVAKYWQPILSYTGISMWCSTRW